MGSSNRHIMDVVRVDDLICISDDEDIRHRKCHCAIKPRIKVVCSEPCLCERTITRGQHAHYGTTFGHMCFYAKKLKISPCKLDRLKAFCWYNKAWYQVLHIWDEQELHRSRPTDGSYGIACWESSNEKTKWSYQILGFSRTIYVLHLAPAALTRFGYLLTINCLPLCCELLATVLAYFWNKIYIPPFVGNFHINCFLAISISECLALWHCLDKMLCNGHNYVVYTKAMSCLWCKLTAFDWSSLSNHSNFISQQLVLCLIAWKISWARHWAPRRDYHTVWELTGWAN